MVTKREFIRLLELRSERFVQEGMRKEAEALLALRDDLLRNTIEQLVQREGGGSVRAWQEGFPYGRRPLSGDEVTTS